MRIFAASRRRVGPLAFVLAATLALAWVVLASRHSPPGVRPVAAGAAGVLAEAPTPPPDGPATALPAGFTVHAGIRYLPGTDRYGVLDAYLPPTGTHRAWVLVLHGGSWAGGDKRDAHALRAVDTFTAAGYAVFSADYPLTGDDPGYTGVSWEVQRAAVETAVAFVERHSGRFGIDPRRGVLYGYSAGGNLAASEAVRKGRDVIRAFVSVSGVMEVQGVTTETLRMWAAIAMRCPYLPENAACAARWRDADPINHLTADAPPALFFAGDNDPLVPAGGAERLAAAMTRDGVPARVVLAHGTGHNDTSWYGSAANTAILLAFLARYTS